LYDAHEEESMVMTIPMTRRSALGRVAGGAAFLSATAASLAERLAATDAAAGVQLKGRVRQSVCKWCYPKVSLDDLCREGKAFGLSSVELLEVKDFETLKKHDMGCAMVSGVPGGITSGLNRLENHDKIVAFFEDTAPKVAAAGFQNIICFSPGTAPGCRISRDSSTAPSASSASCRSARSTRSSPRWNC
jgi:hydroxypyruvate isomerase